ncbi:uncharacterized protein, partial [Antedon mediterranea]|uniref:uncharacterized protein n=1 Tax=Antedon mediterranea TaxID=105859 RepID=UPI003AF4DDBD
YQVLYIFYKWTISCEWADRNILSSIPNIRVVSLGKTDSIGEPLPVDTEYDLPSHWTGIVLELFFPYLVIQDNQAIVGTCQYSFNNPQNTRGEYVYTIQINGCPRSRYGMNCDQICNCSQDIQCHSFNGACICPIGLTGETCEKLDPYLEIDTESLYIKWGSILILNCTAHGFTDTDITITWQRNNTGLENATRNLLEVNYYPRPIQISYYVDNITESDNDIYRCIANNTIVREVTITVIDLPNPFIKTPTNHTVVSGFNMLLVCQVRPLAGVVIWTLNSKTVNNNMLKSTDTLTISSNVLTGESTLTIEHMYLEDEGVYRCFVGHTFEPDDINFAEAYITVIVPPSGDYPVIDTTTESSMLSVSEDDLMMLTCNVYGIRPIPNLKWTIDGKRFNFQETFTFVETDLRFDVASTITFAVYRDYNSKYLTCTMESDEFDNARTSRLLNVTYKPVLRFQPSYIDILEGDDLLVTCNGSGNPVSISYRWECDKSNRGRILQDGQTFSIPDVSSSFDQSRLRCIAFNSVGTSFRTLNVNVRGKGVSFQVVLPVVAVIVLVMLVLVPVTVYRHRNRIQRMAEQFQLPVEKGDKEFDAFISYKGGTEEETFVVQKLVPNLEAMGFAVCVHYKHFLAGNTIMQNILDAIAKSRKTIIVLSPAFVESQWCRYEFITASAEILKSENNVIPLMYEDITKMPKLDVILKELLDRINYITWPRDCNDDDPDVLRFWELMKHSLTRKISPVDALK